MIHGKDSVVENGTGMEPDNRIRGDQMSEGALWLQQPTHKNIPSGMTIGEAIAEMEAFLEQHGYRVEKVKSAEKESIDMEKVYHDLDNGVSVKEVAEGLGINERTLYRRHKKYQEGLPEAKRRAVLVRQRRTGRQSKAIPMEWVYAQVDAGHTVEEVAGQLHVGTRTIYSRHEEYQAHLEKENPESRYVRRTLVGKGTKNGCARRELDMEKVYDELLSGKTMQDVQKLFDLSAPTLKKKHDEYQKQHRGESGKYIREKLIDFRNRKKI